MSLGSPFPSDGTDPMSQAVNRLTAQTGALFVIAAGNSGGEESIGSPGAADAALTVGAVDDEDRLAGFSSRGPRSGVGAIKPDITAPGVGIVAAAAAHGQIGDPAQDGYVSLSGTSMATPHVAGAAAILAGRHPDWTADRLKATLMATAKPTDGASVFAQGAGRVDVAASLSTSVSGEWTFASSHVDGEEPAVIPLLAVRFAPELDSSNAAPAGRFRFPVYVQRNGSATPGRVHTPKVEVSYDDGATWTAVRLTGHHDRWTASVDHPADARFVSLRGSVRDRDGNAVTQTILRAYALR